MNNPLFTVDRRPIIHIGIPIAFGGTDTRWGMSQEALYKTINTATGLRLPGIGTYENIGVQQIIYTMQYHYERGIRRFLINSPQGCIGVDPGGYPAYGGIWDCMSSKSIERPWDGTRFANPFYTNWLTLSNGDPLPTYSTNPSDPYNTLLYLNNGRQAEWYVHLRVWLGSNAAYGYHLGLDGVTAMPDKRGEVEVYIYTGFGIPTLNGAVDHESNYVSVMGESTNQTYQNLATGHGFEMPDPDNDSSHVTYLDQWKKWFENGACGIGGDVGVFAFNYEYGDWVYQNPDSNMPAFHNQKKTNMRRYFENLYNNMPAGTGVGQRYVSHPFSYFVEGHPWNWNKKHGTTNPDIAHPVVGTDEYLDLFGISAPLGDNSAYRGSWQHYTKYIQMYEGLSQFRNNTWQGGSGTAFNGADPNRKWKFDPETTEIHLLANVLPCPYMDESDSALAAYDARYTDADVQALMDACAEYWIDYIDRGYILMSSTYPFSYKVQREIHKRIMQHLGVWPDSDPST